MSFKCGLVGMPNVGKSSIFNLLTKQSISADNYPFCTIDPNNAFVEVPDSRLARLASINKSKKIFFPKNYTKNNMFLEQLSYFLNCLKKRQQPHNDLKSGLIALQNITSFKK